MKRKITLQIAAAVLAIVLTAGLGTAALASSEPPRSAQPAQQQTIAPAPAQPQPTQPQQPRNETLPAPSDEMNGTSGPAPSGEPSEAPAAPAADTGTDTEADGRDEETDGSAEAPSGEPSQEPSQEPDAAPSGEPSQEPSREPDADMSAEMSRDIPENGGAPAAAEQAGGFMQQLKNFFDDLYRRFMSLFGVAQQGSPAQEEAAPALPDRENAGAASQEPSAEMGGSASGEPMDYTAANTVTEDSAGESYTSANGDENAVLVSGDTVTLTDVTVTKTGSSSGENADFYGVNAGVLATNGATLTIENANVTTDGTHANGVFSYGQGTTVNISDSTITTSAANSGGIMTTGGATLNATNLTVSTAGGSSAAIRSDRGGGAVNVTEGSYTASGIGSPAIYSTADISVSDAELTATNSEAVVIEGGNSVTLVNDAVSGNNAKLNGQSTVKTNVLIYQSMSGDAAEGNSSFTMTGGSMTAGTGTMFHVTNVTTEIKLSGVDFTYATDSDVFLDASADSWGKSGNNGGHVSLNLDGQDIVGVITTDSVSTVAVNLQGGSTWTLTGDSYVTSLSGDASGIDLNGYTLYVNGVAYSG